MTGRERPLDQYRRKRDFSRTGEPEGAARPRDGGSRDPIFVVQKHAATALHYDFRLEVDGVLKSWAVPKGPSLDPSVKRLAMPTEDHPIEYASFEGSIPDGEYGAGPVIVWDAGTFKPARENRGKIVPMARALDEGRVEIEMSGEKLRGAFALFRTGALGGRERWLLVKMKDAHAARSSDITAERPESIVSGRTIEDLGGARRPARRRKKGPAAG